MSWRNCKRNVEATNVEKQGHFRSTTRTEYIYIRQIGLRKSSNKKMKIILYMRWHCVNSGQNLILPHTVFYNHNYHLMLISRIYFVKKALVSTFWNIFGGSFGRVFFRRLCPLTLLHLSLFFSVCLRLRLFVEKRWPLCHASRRVAIDLCGSGVYYNIM